jgi:myo-inositol 2-dehydrogenase/D-chiro-inositol 1-dehydrogenase
LLNRVPRANVVAVCSNVEHELSWAREEYKGSGIEVYTSYEEMLAHPKLNAVWISTSTDVHARQTLAGIEKGLHVLCEKPLSTDMEEVRHEGTGILYCICSRHWIASHAFQLSLLSSRLQVLQAQGVVDAAAKHPKLKVMAGFSRRFDASYRDAKKKIADESAIGKPFLVRSQTADLLDHTGFFVKYASRNGAIFVDCAIHDIDLSLWYLDNPIPKAAWSVGTLQHHPELKEFGDVDNGVGIVEYWGGKIAYFYCSRTQAHGHDVCTEITGTEGKIMVNVIPKRNNVVLADKLGMRHEVQPEYWQRFEDAFATEANEFIAAVLDDKPVPLPLSTGMMVMKIAWALQDALATGERIQFDEKGSRLDKKPKL